MNTLYLDVFSGISGDMFLGALIDLGLDPQKLEHELEKLKVSGYHLHISRGQKSGIAGVKFDVHLHDVHEHGHDQSHSAEHHHGESHGHDHRHGEPDRAHAESRNFSQIQQLIDSSALSPWVKTKSLAVFQRIAGAEGAIHGLPPERVHFHEVGAVDSIVDIVGACIGLELLGKPRVLASRVVEGVGSVNCAHGRFPIPAPATLAILGARGIGITQCEEPHELVTPTGAALLAELVENFEPMAGLVAKRIGFGLGSRNHQTRPNVLRAILGEVTEEASSAAERDWETDTVAVLETNIDDISAEILGSFVETSLGQGALDVFHTPVSMKKNRPGVLLTVLCREADADRFCELMFRETSAFGVRRRFSERRKLRREFVSVKTQFGEVTVKIGKLNGEVVQASPEFDSCKKLAEQSKVPVKEIYEAAVRSLRK